ncbi:MAG: hypothetical protein IJL24_08570, partial [Treponema sp.]|nr:hypothetical protein [Treponema sp.]
MDLDCRQKKSFPLAALLIPLFFFSLFFFSCDNSSSDSSMFDAGVQMPAAPSAPAPAPSQPVITVNENGIKTIAFNGTLSGAGGAFPARMSAQVSALVDGGQIDGLSKSARPDLDTSSGGYELFATATADGAAEARGDFGPAELGSRSFSMNLAVGKTWRIVCGIRAAGGGSVM